jgi:hypothetical protein
MQANESSLSVLGFPGKACARSGGSKSRRGCFFDSVIKVLANHPGRELHDLRRDTETWWMKIEQALIQSSKMAQMFA